MRLRALHIRRLPGIDPGFEVRDVAPGINVVVGPNASGKSSVLRAVRALLYPEELKRAPVDLDAIFEDEGGALRVTRVGDIIEWSRGGARVPRPDLPAHHLVGCYTLGVEELAALSGTDDEIARQLALELLGGYDLAAVRENGALKPPGSGRSEAERLRRSEDHLREILRAREELARQQGNLARWRRELDEARAAAEDAAAHRRALALLESRREVGGLQERLAAFPDGMDRLVGNEGERLETLRTRREDAEEQFRQARARRDEAQRALSSSGLEGSGLTQGDLEEHRSLLQDLHRLEGDAEGLAAEASRAGARLHQAYDELRTAPAAAGTGATADGAPAAPREIGAASTRAAPGIDVAGAEAGDVPGAEPAPQDRPRLDPATLRRAEDSLATKRDLDAERRALQRQQETLPDPEEDAGAEPMADVERLREGRRALTAFLATARAHRFTLPRAVGLFLTVAGAGAAVALAAVAGSDWRPLAAAGVVAAAGLPLLLRGGGAAARRDAASRYRAAGLPEPDSWDEAAVQARLVRLDEALVRAAARREALARGEEVARRLARLEGELASADAQLRSVAERVGFDPRHLDADFQRWLRLVEAADHARGELEEARAELTRAQERIARLRASLHVFLEAHGEAPTTPDAGASVLQRRLEALAGRLADRNTALANVRAADADIARAETERDRQAEEIRELFAGAGIGDAREGTAAHGRRTLAAEAERTLTAALHDRLERLPAFKDVRDRLHDAEARRKERARELGERRDLIARLDADDESGLRAALRSLEETAQRQEELARDITRTETLVAEAERDRALEGARAERQEAADALADLFEATLRAEAGRVLLDAVAAEHEERSQPPALRRAAEWFLRFTRNRFELAYDGGREPPFAAVETASGERRLPAELSTGTRAQLLLAVRVAFALEAEAGGVSLPLFLDEALTTADVERFREVADALAMLAEQDGRQLFYLTARGEDAALWQPRPQAAPPGEAEAARSAPHVIDIAQLRNAAEAVTAPELLAADPPPDVPAPGDLPPERYGALLGVPPLDPWRSSRACHPFHLLRDCLPLLQRLVQAGADRVGPLTSLLRTPAADALLSGGERALLARRVRALEAFLDGWRRGRGRPVDRDALLASGAVSDTFLDRVDALARDVGGDARALLQGLERGDVPRFRTRDREALEAWLADGGYLDERAPLDTAALRLRLVAALAAASHGPTDAGVPQGGGTPVPGAAEATARPDTARPDTARPDTARPEAARPDGAVDALGEGGASRDALEEAAQLTAWLLAALGATEAQPGGGAGPSAVD